MSETKFGGKNGGYSENNFASLAKIRHSEIFAKAKFLLCLIAKIFDLFDFFF